ncbi:MAG: hypothetical protein NVS1B11_30330 [Terriglobales bacterium]
MFSSLEDLETRSAAILLFLKDQGTATDEKLVPYLEQAGNTSNVRWRAARVRLGGLIASAMKSQAPASEKREQKTAEEEKEPRPSEKPEAKEVSEDVSELRSDEPTNAGQNVKTRKSEISTRHPIS